MSAIQCWSATVGAACNVQLQLLFKVGKTLVKLLGQPAREALGFGESEFAKFRAGTGHRSANECGALHGKAVSGQGRYNGLHMGLGNVDEQKILHRRGANQSIGVLLGEIGGKAKLRGSDSPTDD